MVPYGNRFQFIGTFSITKVSYIFVNDVNKVLSTSIDIVVLSLPNRIFTLQFKYIGKDVLQCFPGLLVCQRHFCSKLYMVCV